MILLILFASTASAYLFDPNTPFGQCFTKHCSGPADSCWSALCEPLYSGCSIPCSTVYSYEGCACENMCRFAAGKEDGCIQAYLSSAGGCFSGCWSGQNPGSCASACESKARAQYHACVEQNTPTTTTQPDPCGDGACAWDEDCASCPEDCYCGQWICDPNHWNADGNGCVPVQTEGCDLDGACEPAQGESCENCARDCDCMDLLCSPGMSGATSWGCYDPCLDVDHASYDKVLDMCMCDLGYVANDAGTLCVLDSECPENSHLEGSECYCDQGWGNCDSVDGNGCEQNLNARWNCGGCGLECPENSVCEDMQCVCEEGYEPDEKGESCVLVGCNKNGVCEPERNENCGNCPDCACELTKEYCDGFTLYPGATDEKGCRDCERYCELEYGDPHMDAKKPGKDYMCMCECELGYEWSDDDKCVEAKKKAYVFISKGLGARHQVFSSHKVSHISNFYEEQGYEVHLMSVKDAGAITETLAKHPEITAIAYFGHGKEPEAGQTLSTPTMESMDAASLKNMMNQELTFEYNERGLSIEDARKKADEKLKDGFGLDYAYIHACYSYDDPSLAESLVKKGGTFWGDKGKLHPYQTLYEHKRE